MLLWRVVINFVLILLIVVSLLCLVGSAATQCSPSDMVNCFVDPCTETRCPAYPTATCRPNYCGGCNAEFYTSDGTEVTALCNSRPTQCSNIVNCLINPCTVTTCPAYPNAECRANYCGGCNAEFYTADDTEVTAQCNHICPPPEGFGLCFEQCSADRVCPSGRLCCSTGCGHACMEGIAPTSRF